MFSHKPSNKRGHTQIGWLNSYHSFSYGLYQDKELQNFGVLKALNDNTFAPQRGVSMHKQTDMEIICLILDGKLEHKDSLGQKKILKANDIQLTSAGNGIYHSELNTLNNKPLRFLQIWISPSKKSEKPTYNHKKFTKAKRLNKLCLIASPTGKNNTLQIRQDCNIFRTSLEGEKEICLTTDSSHKYWLHIISGSLDCNGEILSSGDGLGIEREKILLHLQGNASETDFLLFELPA